MLFVPFFVCVPCSIVRSFLSMEAWRAGFGTVRQHLREESDDDEFILGLLLGLEGEDDEEVGSRVGGGSRPGKGANIERHRVEMHSRMIAELVRILLWSV